MISKTSYIRYDMKSLKVIEGSIWDHPPLVYEGMDSRNNIRLKSLTKVVEILEKLFSMISYSHQY